jgi:hypothetical protein
LAELFIKTNDTPLPAADKSKSVADGQAFHFVFIQTWLNQCANRLASRASRNAEPVFREAIDVFS